MAIKNKTGGKPPYGYTWKDGGLVLVPEEVPIYAEIFDLYLIHQRKRTVARLLNEKGYRTRANKEFSYTSIDRFLKNPIAKGVHRYSVTEKGSGTHKTLETSVPSIVSEEIWNQAQEIMTSQAGSQTRKPAQDVFVGKIFCKCEKPMEILSKSTSYSCHKCKSNIAIDDIHAIFENAITDIPFPSAEELEKITQSDNHDSVPAIKSRITKLEHDSEKLFELYSAQAITAEIFKQRHDKLQSRIVALNKSLASAKNKPATSFITLYDFWKTLDNSKKHTVVDTIVARITIISNVASLSFYPLFNFAQDGPETTSNGAILEDGGNT